MRCHGLLFIAALSIASWPAAAQPAAPSWPPLDRAPATGSRGTGTRDVAVVVGISDYLVLPDIAGAADNAIDWQSHLLSVRGTPADRVVTLTNSEARRERIIAAVTQMVSRADPEGAAIFIFVGHGAPAPGGRDGLLLGVDAFTDVQSFSERGILQAEVLAALRKGRQKETVVIFDACFSGASVDGAPLIPGLMATVPVRAVAATTASAPIILSASDSFAGPLPGTKRPAFSYVLLGGLRGWGDANADGVTHLAEAFQFARRTMETTFKSTARQPSWRGPERTALSGDVVEAAPDIASIMVGRCPANTSWDGFRCVKAGCPEGSTWTGSACVASSDVQCPPGTTWNGKGCAGVAVSCPPGTSWNGTACAHGQGTARDAVTALLTGRDPTSPPPPSTEKAPPPRPGYVWAAGQWEWRDGKWSFKPGHYERDRKGMVWMDGEWRQSGDVWLFKKGGWSKPEAVLDDDTPDTLSVQQIRSQVDPMRNGAMRCGLKAHGSLKVKLKIGPTGSVDSAQVDIQDPGAEGVTSSQTACVQKVALKLKFPESRRGATTSIPITW